MIRGVERAVVWVAALLVAGLLLRSAMGHLQNEYKFMSDVYMYRLTGQMGGALLAAVLPFVQLTLGVALLFMPRLQRAAFGLAVALFGCFATAQLTTLARGLDISCGCFGASNSTPIGWTSIGLAVGGLAVSAIGWRLAPGGPLDPPQPSSPVTA